MDRPPFLRPAAGAGALRPVLRLAVALPALLLCCAAWAGAWSAGAIAAAPRPPAAFPPGARDDGGLARPQRLAQAGRPAETVIVTETDDGRTLNLRRGEQLRVVLGDRAGTGYAWEIESIDRRLLRPEGQRTWQDPGPPPSPGLQGPVGLVGGPLQVSFLFRAVAGGEGELVLRHWRSWEGPRSVDRRLRLRLRVVD